MKLTPEKAKGYLCPKMAVENGSCIGRTCMAWRWHPLQASNPEFLAAIKDAMPEHKNNHQAAVKWVMANREKLGLPAKPTHGYCGLAGEVKA